jgi:hypothetical protein
VLSDAQENYARLNGLLPRGSLTSFRMALAHSGAFRAVYSRRTAWIFKYSPPGDQTPPVNQLCKR